MPITIAAVHIVHQSAQTSAAAAPEARLAALVADHEVSEKRRESLFAALTAGAPDETLVLLRDALRVSTGLTVTLPAHRYENLSRGRGWARAGRGDAAVWGERVSGGYRVGPGRWTVGATDGFSRKASDTWAVMHVTIGTETWTVAS